MHAIEFLNNCKGEAKAGCKQKRSYAVNTCQSFSQNHDSRGGKGRGGGTGQRGLCREAAHAEREGQVRTNDEI